jgi:hypothetical protein
MITSMADKIWKNMEHDQTSCEILFSQMRSYKLKIKLYHEKFKASEKETPKIWWLSTDDNQDYLQKLTLYILSITPHSASCE